MASDVDNHREVGEAIRVTAEGLGPWIGARIDVWPPDSHGRVSPPDPAYQAFVLLDKWMSIFGAELGAENLHLVHKYKDFRDRWAHFKFKSFDDGATATAVDACRGLLHAIGSAYERDVPESNEPSTSPRHSSTSQHRKAASREFRLEQWKRREAPHVALINRLVDDLIAEHRGLWMPYVAPYHGGINAEVLLLFQDPGKMTSTTHGGSGFLGGENNDPSADLFSQCLDDAGVSQRQVTPWNSYPWFRTDQNKTLTVAMRKEGIEPLERLLLLLPKAHTVVTFGKIAEDTWGRFSEQHPNTANRIRHLHTFHTSGRGITNGGQQPKKVGVADVVAKLKTASVPPA